MKKTVSYRLKGELAYSDDKRTRFKVHEFVKDVGEVERDLSELLDSLIDQEVTITIRHVTEEDI